MSFTLRLLVSAAALWVATRIVPGVTFEGDWLAMFGVALTFGIVNAFVRPVTWVLAFPFIIATLGFFLLVINGLMLMLTSRISGSLGLGFHVRDFRAAFLGALVVSIVSMVIGALVKDSSRTPQPAD